MISRFSIPENIQDFSDLKGRTLFEITKSDIVEVRSKMKALRGDSFKNPDVTVAIIAFNEEENLFATLKSISKQATDYNVEVVLVDNNSSDNTSLLAGFCGVNVFSEKSKGVAFARQKALEEASGTYYVSCDGDTIYPEHWLQTLVKPLVEIDEVAVSYSLHALIDENKSYPIGLFAYQYAKLCLIFIRGVRRGQLNCGGASSAFRVKDANRIGGYNTRLKRGSDGFIALQLTELGRIEMVSKKKAMVYTSNRRMQQDGSIINAFSIRFKYGMRHMFSFLSTQKIPTS